MEASEALELLDARINNENMDENKNNKGPEEKGHELKRVEKKCQFTQMSRCQNHLEESIQRCNGKRMSFNRVYGTGGLK